jgi:hypothetical protein
MYCIQLMTTLEVTFHALSYISHIKKDKKLRIFEC